MNYLVVGASGFIGSHVFGCLRAQGSHAVGTKARAVRADLASFDLRHDRILERDDLRFPTAGAASAAVICASICQIDRCFRERATSRIINVDKTIVMIDDLCRIGAKTVFLSSSHVFDGGQGYYNEQHPVHPISEYGRQKAAVEEYILGKLPHGLVLRLDKIVGELPDESHPFSDWWQSIQERRPIFCIAGQVLSPTLVTDVARAVALSCEQGLSGLYHVANQEFFERADLARQFVQAAGSDVPVITRPIGEFRFDDQRPLKTHLDGTKFITATNMRFTAMHDAMQRFLQFAKGR